MTINNNFICGYYIGGYWWLFYWWPLVVILLMDNEAYFINGDFINGY
jgi:hypothetical protein